MAHHVEPTQQHLDEAFARQHKPDWPVHTRADLARAALLYSIVMGSAHRLANGRPLAPVKPDLAGPITNAPPARSTPRPTSARANGHTERRRRDDSGPDLKSLAAGERADD